MSRLVTISGRYKLRQIGKIEYGDFWIGNVGDGPLQKCFLQGRLRQAVKFQCAVAAPDQFDTQIDEIDGTDQLDGDKEHCGSVQQGAQT